ncbi:MAG: hypothetical protein HZA77_14960 [Candidatus Schekmanbacteria bacterium]|nr:hypothetical protein [Candidatus Schekmanbacteria bacterium]
MIRGKRRALFYNSLCLFIVAVICVGVTGGCSKNEGPKQGSLMIATKKSDGQPVDCRIVAYAQDNHLKAVNEGVSGLEMYLPEGKYDIKIDWRGNLKWLEGIDISEAKKFTDTVIFPAGKIKVKSVNNDGSVADASILIVPARDRQNGIEAVADNDGKITEFYINGQKIALGNTLEEIDKVLKPEMLRTDVVSEKEGSKTYETRYYKVFGANLDLSFLKDGEGPLALQKINYTEKVAAGIAGEAIEVSPGLYDMKVEHQGVAKWSNKIKIADKETREEEVVFDQGWIVVNATNYSSDKGTVPVQIYFKGDSSNAIKNGKLGEKIPLVPGTYDVMVEYKSKYIWIREINLKVKETVQKTIKLPEG